MNIVSARFSTYLPWAAAALAIPLVAFGVNAAKDKAQRYSVAVAIFGADPAQAPPLFRRYGCGGCHVITGIAGADGKVGGPLVGLRQRVYVGGVATNTPENLVDWIVAPQRFSPRSAMPATGISEDEARHLAAYLYAN